MNTEDLISNYVEEFLESESGKYVVLDCTGMSGQVKVLYENDLKHCIAWTYKTWCNCKICSREAYDKHFSTTDSSNGSISSDASCPPMYY